MFKNKSIVLQVDESTRLLMDEIKGKISEDILESIDGIAETVSSLSEALYSIGEKVQNLDGIDNHLKDIDEIKSTADTIFNELKNTHHEFSERIIAWKTALDEILSEVKKNHEISDSLVTKLDDLADKNERIRETSEIIKGTTQKIDESLTRLQGTTAGLDEKINSILHGIEQANNSLLEGQREREQKLSEIDNHLENIFHAQLENRQIQLRTLYYSIPFWKVKERKAIKERIQ